ncbi:uncharacterized protein E1O_12570 [Burkholderiales bacterium GJ-E10]|nr:uncharacterized protein E1O_12570 [Burkholderiales bacterium GJ-E10]
MGLIYLDSCLVIYAFENHPQWGEPVRAALARAPERFAISPLVTLECLVAPMRSGNLTLQRYYEQGLQQFEILPMPEGVYAQAALLRARWGLKTPDALHLSTAVRHGCTALWTADNRLQRAAHGLAVNVLAA